MTDEHPQKAMHMRLKSVGLGVSMTSTIFGKAFIY
jgi:hypothetical protein